MDTQTPDMQAVVERQCRELAERLNKVEGQCATLERQNAVLGKQNRRLKVAGIVALVLVPVLVLSCGASRNGATTNVGAQDVDGVAELIKTKRLIIVDERGKPRIQATAAEGLSWLEFLDQSNKRRLAMWADQSGVGIGLFDDKNDSGVMLTHIGTPDLRLSDETGNTRVKIRSEGIALLDKKEHVVWQAPPPGDTAATVAPDNAPEEAEPEEE